MVKRLLMAVAVMVLATVTVSARAEVRNLDTYPDDCPGMLDPDQCMDQPLANEPTITACTAYAGFNQRCKACVDDGTGTGRLKCGGVNFSGSCTCGTSTRGCSSGGTCTYTSW